MIHFVTTERNFEMLDLAIPTKSLAQVDRYGARVSERYRRVADGAPRLWLSLQGRAALGGGAFHGPRNREPGLRLNEFIVKPRLGSGPGPGQTQPLNPITKLD